MNLSFVLQNIPFLLEGAKITAALAICTLVGSILGGTIVAAARMSRIGPLRAIGSGFVELMRNTPILVQIFVLYFGLPSVGLTMTAFTSAVLALTMQNSAYIGEIFRSGVQSVHRRQTEAALALGMMPQAALWTIIVPQAIRRVIPALGGQFIIIVKDTSIASTIAVAELTQAGKLLLDRSAAPYETFLLMALFYLCMTAVVLLLLKLIELRFPLRV